MVNCIPKLGRLKKLRREGLAPELLRGQSFQFNPPSPRVPMVDVRGLAGGVISRRGSGAPGVRMRHAEMARSTRLTKL